MIQRTYASLLTCLVLACGGKKDEPKPVKEDAAPGPTVAPIAIPASGVDSIGRMNYQWGSPGSRDYGRALVACCTKGKPRDWAATKSYTEAALAKDPQHIGAHWLLGVALAQTGDHAAAVDHVVHAVSADHGKYGANLAGEKDLEPFMATQHGASVKELAAKIGEDYKTRAASGLLLVARRSSFKWPDKPDVQYSTTRGELYAYDRELKRYLRLTHTNDSVAGFVRSPSGSEIAVLGFDKIDRPKGDDATPLIVRAFVITIDTKDWKPGQKTTINGPAREVSLGYGAGENLLVATAPANGRWGVGAPVVSSIDRSTGKATKVQTDMPLPRIVFSLEEGRLMRVPPDQVKATWAGDPPTAPTLTVGEKQIAVQESHQATRATVALGSTHLAFATAVDPCAQDTAPSLYVADIKSGTQKHLLTAKSRFTTRWLTPTLLAYEDGDGAIRLWDSAKGREEMKLENKPGLALDVLSLAPAPLCKGAPPNPDVGSGSGDELPPEESGSNGGPVTAPQ
jgi:hypothetical protein